MARSRRRPIVDSVGHPTGTGGHTELANTGPLCPRHNRYKTRGYRTWRDPHGHWHTYRPDGTEIAAA